MAAEAAPRAAVRRGGRLLAGLLTLALGACTLFGGDAPETSPPAGEEAGLPDGSVAQSGPQVAYEVAIQGVEDDELRTLLEEVSEARRLIDRPPPNLVRLRRRAEGDRQNLERALRSRGYYDGEVTVALDTTADPVRVLFNVTPGPVYRFRDVTIDVTPSVPGLTLPGLEDLGIAPGEPARSEAILDAEAALLAAAKAQGHALAELGRRRAVVDHDAEAMDLTLALQPGPLVTFGPIRIQGLDQVREDAVRRRLPWQEGEPITTDRLAEGRSALLGSELFSTARIELGETPDDAGRLPVTVILNERKHRSIGLGVRFRTDEGLGGNLSWEHRNFFGAGERVKVELDGSFIGGHIEGSFRKPDVWRRDQALIARSRLAYETTEAFNGIALTSRLGLERVLRPGMTLAGGVGFRASRVEDVNGDEDSFGLISLPVEYAWDRSDDLLNPTRGGRLAVDNEPFVDVLGNDIAFNKTRLSYTHYLRVMDSPGVILAGRGAAGTLFGASRGDVPADLRFYAGGGGSVRGFGFQLAGELDEDHKPIGGRSVLELSGEVRVRVTETIGVVAFVDAGSAFSSTLPDLSEPLRIGAGPGLRYFSPIGPIRLDVGFPINRRDSDDAFQLYISLGQAF